MAEDLVFCATGATGTDAPSAERVANEIAALAAAGPLDFVLLPGDNFAPAGVASVDDPQWQSKFELRFDRDRLSIPFFPAFGAADHRGDLTAQIQYGVFNSRWTLADHTYHFVEHSHGETFTFIALDSPSLIGPLGISRNRHAGRFVSETLMATDGGWKIVFGHHPVFEGAPPEAVQRSVGDWLSGLGVDVYIAGGAPELDTTRSASGVVQVRTGTSGFAWFRFDGEALEVSLRDQNGVEVGTRRLEKRATREP